MAKIEKPRPSRRTRRDDIFPLERENFIILGVGLIVILLGYIALSGNSVDGFRQITIAPILLLLGYCVLIPIGIMYRKKSKPANPKPVSSAPPQQ